MTIAVLARRSLCTFLLLAAVTTAATAHGGRAGDIVITHPFATPTPAGSTQGAAYLVALENTGPVPDRLVRASTPAAARVELHTMAVDAGNVMRMREVADLPLEPGKPVKMRPGAGVHLMLIGLKAPLKEGDRFPLVQQPKVRGAEEAGHRH